jgi:hypothetical protein
LNETPDRLLAADEPTAVAVHNEIKKLEKLKKAMKRASLGEKVERIGVRPQGGNAGVIRRSQRNFSSLAAVANGRALRRPWRYVTR